LYIINNKYTEEWRQHPSEHGNYLSLDTLKLLFEKLQDDYQVVYIRPQHSERGFSPDGHGLPPFKDHEMIRDQYPKVLTIQDLLENNKDLDFNTIQLMVHSNSEKFISVVGGNGLFSSYFGGTNIIYGKTTRLGPAIQGWWKDLSGCKISYVKSWKDLLREVDHREVKLSIRKMDIKDIPLFNEIRNECREWLHNPQEFSIEESKEWFKNKKDKFFILGYDKQDIGYFRTSNYDPSNNSIFVGLDIHRLHRGKGISTRAYLQFFKKIQKELGIRNMFLRVLKKNKRAFSLYEKLGFKVLDKTDDDFFMYLNMQEVQWGAK
jgi:RimJ/RimL family protein N-acetyltransferase